MIKRHMLLRTATAALLSLTATAAASADIYTPTSEALTDPKIGPAQNEQAAALGTQNAIVVVADQADYAFAKPTNLALPFHLKTEVTKNKWRIKESYIVIDIAPISSGGQVGSCCGSLTDFNEFNYAARIDHGATKKVDMDGWWTVAVGDNSIGTRARNACRNLRKELEQQRVSHDDIFGQDRYTVLSTPFRYVARVGHKNDNHDIVESGATSREWKQSQPSWYNIGVVCERRATSDVVGDPKPLPTGSDDLAAGFQVNQAALAITPKNYAAKCPAKLHLNPTIEATGKGVVRYRFRDQFGQASQEFQVAFEKSDVKFLDHVITLDGKGAATGLGFTTQPEQGGELGLLAPNDPNLLQGYFQLEVVAPHAKKSNIADYSVKCTVRAVGGLTSAPDTVNPVIVEGLTAKPQLADLMIEEAAPSPAVPNKLFVKITNVGKVASTPTNLKAFRTADGETKARGTLVPAMGPGQSQVILAELGGGAETASAIALAVDDPNRIAEFDESNNVFQYK